LTRYRERAETAGLCLKTSPAPADLPVVMGDQARLSQALAEIVENAITFTHTGGTIVLTAGQIVDADQRWVTVAVRDTGPGMTLEEQEKAFDRFFRGHLAESGHIPGTGLGLSFAQEVLRAHGGRVTLESALNVGSTFTLWMLAEDKEAEENEEGENKSNQNQ
jgi:signal transduction histidine kinase